MRQERTEKFQIVVLLICAAVFISMCILSALGVRPPAQEISYLVVAVVVLGGLYLASHRWLHSQIVALHSALEGVQNRESLNLQVVESLARAIDARDQRGQGRAERVRDLAALIAEEMGIRGEGYEAIRIAALLADIGKLAIPDYILSKPGPLNEEERRKVKTHPLVGASILAGVRFSAGVVPIVRGHHEWFDGTGYPDGLKGEQIPIGARILSAADVYNALLSDRPHRHALSPKEAADIMEQGAGTQFEPKVISAFFRVLSRERVQERFGFIFDADEITSWEAPQEFVTDNQRAAFADIAQAQRELLALFEIVQTMATSLNMQETLELLMSKIRKILKFTTGVIFFCDRGTKRLRAAATCGLLAPQLHNRFLRWGDGISGQVAETGHAAELNADARADYAQLLDEAQVESCPLAYALVVPLYDSQTGVCGTISLYQASGSPFSEDDLRLLNTVAAQASIAITKARAFEQTERTALTDPLTNLPNARHFFLQMEQELSRANRENRPLSLLLLDIDGFKAVNDTFGHQQGDRVLRELADIFRSVVREYDLVARYGGDEFFLLLPTTNNQQAMESALRLKEAVSRYNPQLGEENGLRLQVSVGVATYPGDATEAKALLAAADKAMYADKELGRAQSQIFKMMSGFRGAGSAAVTEPAEAAPSSLEMQSSREEKTSRFF